MAPLGAGKVGLFAAAGSGGAASAGYFAGGRTAYVAYVATHDKFAFADDTRSAVTSLNTATKLLGGMANSGTAGYYGGGIYSGSGYGIDTVDKYAFTADTMTTLGTGLSYITEELTGFANSGTAGYFGGGWTYSGGFVYLATVDKFAFSDDGRTTLGTGLSAGRSGLAGMADSGTAGYVGGGYTGSNVDTVDKFAFSDDSRSTLGARLPAARRFLSAMANSGTAGYFGGGYSGAAYFSTVDKFAFSDDSRTTLGTGLSAATQQSAAMANSGTL